MSRAQAAQLYAAGGFPISADGKNPTNRCGGPANPKITFVDMNGDKRREALFIDASACYKPDGRWYAVATQDAAGNWRGILSGVGTVQAAGTMANGWFVLNIMSGGKTQAVAFNGQAYGPRGATAAAPAPVPATPPKAPMPAPTSAAAAIKPAAAPAAPTPAARDAAIFRAAGSSRPGAAGKADATTPARARLMMRARSSR